MEYFKIADKYYEQTNHYKDKRTPPWIKLHNNLFEDYDFIKLPDEERYHFLASMMLASRSGNKIVYDSDWVTRKIDATEKVNLDKFKEKGFVVKINELGEEIVDDIIPLADCQQNADTKRREEKRREENKLTKEKQEKEKESLNKKRPKHGKLKTAALEILDFLNEKSGREYLPGDTNLNFIMMRLKESLKFKPLEEAITDCRMIIVKKCREWGGDEKMYLYLRPKTLFGKTNFSQYQGELVCKTA